MLFQAVFMGAMSFMWPGEPRWAQPDLDAGRWCFFMTKVDLDRCEVRRRPLPAVTEKQVVATKREPEIMHATSSWS